MNIYQDEYEQIVLAKREKNVNPIKSSYFYAMNNSLKEKRPKAFPKKKENIVNMERELNNIIQEVAVTETTKLRSRQVLNFINRNMIIKKNQHKIMKDMHLYNTNIFN